VDPAARVDASDIVDVKICHTMMNIKGIARDDIPAFIDRVPDGQSVECLQNGVVSVSGGSGLTAPRLA